jgi:hypothetical protein
MKHFFDLTFRPFFIFTGIGTALGGVNAFWPQWAAEKVILIPFNQDYTIILKHWGFMLGVMGVFMILAAFWEPWRRPILIFSVFEKTFFVYQVATNISRPYARGLWFAGGMDATVVLYTIVYFIVCGFTTVSLRPEGVLHQVRKLA